MNASRPRIILRALWTLAIVTVITGSLLPGNSFPIRALDRVPISDKIEHFVAYSLLVLLPALHEYRRLVIISAIGAILLGIGLEFGQLYSGLRDYEVGDMIIDGVGVCLGLASGLAIRLYCGAFRSAPTETL